MDIIQSLYDDLASQYDKLFLDWQATTKEQSLIFDKLFKENGYGNWSKILDCACGIGTQAIGFASMGYDVTASDISDGELEDRAVHRDELTNILLSNGCSNVIWKSPEETGFYQPIIIAKK